MKKLKKVILKFVAVLFIVSILSSCGPVIHGTYVDTPSRGILWDDGTFDELPDGSAGDGSGND